jgi:hypothetical protein
VAEAVGADGARERDAETDESGGEQEEQDPHGSIIARVVALSARSTCLIVASWRSASTDA